MFSAFFSQHQLSKTKFFVPNFEKKKKSISNGFNAVFAHPARLKCVCTILVLIFLVFMLVAERCKPGFTKHRLRAPMQE